MNGENNNSVFVDDSGMFAVDIRGNECEVQDVLDKQVECLTIPHSLKVDGKEYNVFSIMYPLSSCLHLKKVVIEADLWSVKRFTFGKCMELESVLFTGKPKVIMSAAFIKCPKLRYVVVHKDINVAEDVLCDCPKAKVHRFGQDENAEDVLLWLTGMQGDSCIRIINYDSTTPFKPEHHILGLVQELFLSGPSRPEYRRELLEKIPVVLVNEETMFKYGTPRKMCQERYLDKTPVTLLSRCSTEEANERSIRNFCKKNMLPIDTLVVFVCPELIAKQCVSGNTEAFVNLAVTTIVNSYCHAYMGKFDHNLCNREYAIVTNAMAHLMLSDCVENNQKHQGTFRDMTCSASECFETNFSLQPTDSRILAARLKALLWNPDAVNGNFLFDEWAKNRNDDSSEFYQLMMKHYKDMDPYFVGHALGHAAMSEHEKDVMNSFQHC